MRGFARIAIACVLSLCVLGGCGGDAEDGSDSQAVDELGPSEDALRLIALPGYAEDGSRDPSADWVTPFEGRTGCMVTSTVAESPDEVARLIRSGRYDGVAARGDVSGRLVADGYVTPINTELIPNYADLFEGLRTSGPQIVNSVHYGVPQGRRANLLTWRPALIKPDRDEVISSELIFDPELASRYAGLVTMPDTPMTIADAALYLREHEPQLGIEDVYELDQEQFDAAIEVLREQRRFVGGFWSDPSQTVRDFRSGAAIAGIAWLGPVHRVIRTRPRLEAIVPRDGATGIVDVWMLASDARHPNCMYRWMDWMIGPDANAALARRTAQAPANERACNLIPMHCDVYRAADDDLFDDVEYWTTPPGDCGEDACATYRDWARAFAELKAGR